ncbi:MAG: hypothetical protein NVSMB21_14850 [Vulcanimicrobiaceae bacterium]
MSARVEVESTAATAAPVAALGELAAARAVGAPTLDPDDASGPHLPSDHPAWLRDAVSLSQRARRLIANLKPVALRVVRAWEHRARSIVVAGRMLSVDASGSYRMD